MCLCFVHDFFYEFQIQSPDLMSQLRENRFDNMHRFVSWNSKLILYGIEKSRTPDCLPDAKGSDHRTNKNDGANVWFWIYVWLPENRNKKKNSINHVRLYKNMLKLLI